MLWQNAPSIIIGRNQNALAEINVEYVKAHSIPVVRRLTGGGAVFHDLGNLNYTFIVNDSEGSGFDFKRHTAPILEVLHSLSINAKFSGRNDLTIDDRKFSGNSQYRYKGRLLHHGTLLFSSSLPDISSALKVDPSKFQGKSVQSVRSRVTNISEHLKAPLVLMEFKQLITANIQHLHHEFDVYTLSKGDTAAVSQLEKDKYTTWGWNYGSSPVYNVVKQKKFPSGNIEVFLDVFNGVIQDMHIFGDFFGEREVSDIENSLTGLPYEESAVRQKLSKFILSRYFSGIRMEDLLSLLF